MSQSMQHPFNALLAPKKRAKHSRSRLGCGVCRIRHVRCDQARPACKRCSSTGRTCDGYHPSSTDVSRTLALAPRRAPEFCRVEPEEVFALRHFQQSTSRELAGDFGDDFWGSIVLQASVKEPSIRSVTVALACIHGYLQPLPDMASLMDRLKRLALSHYLAGIHQLNTLITRYGWSRLDDILLCSILCILFEWRQGKYSWALVHLRSSLYILQQWLDSSKTSSASRRITIKKTSPEGRFVCLTLIPVLAKMLLQTGSLLDACTLAIALPKVNMAGELVPVQDFNTLTEARDVLFTIIAQEYLDPGPPATSLPSSLFYTQQNQWAVRLDTLLQESNVGAGENRAAILTLQTWRATARVMGMRRMAHSDAIYNQFNDEFHEIFTLCSKLVELQGCTFTADISVVLVLYFVAFHAPDFALRRKTIELLVASRRCEGIWDSGLAAAMASRALEVDGIGLHTDSEVTQFFWNLQMGETWKEEQSVEIRTVQL